MKEFDAGREQFKTAIKVADTSEWRYRVDLADSYRMIGLSIMVEKQITPEVMGQIERWVSLNVIDNLWMEHLDAIDDLREGIGLRGYGQLDPLVEYKNEAFSMFERLIATIDSDIVHRIYKVQVQMAPNQAQQSMAFKPAGTPEAPKIETKLSQAAEKAREAAKASVTVINSAKKLGRNDPCWCGSGKKWKKCHYPKLG